VRQEVAELVHQVDAQLVVLDAHVYVHAADQQPAGGALHLRRQRVVTFPVGGFLVQPAGPGMGGRGHRRQPVLPGHVHHRAAQPRQILADFLDGVTDPRADLDLGPHELRTHLAAEAFLALIHDRPRRVGAQVTGLLVDEQVFFFNADRESRLRMSHWPATGSRNE